LYENLIRDIEDRINPLSVVTLVNVVIGQVEDPAAALAFVEPLRSKIAGDNAASIALKTTVVSLHTRLGEFAEAKEVLAGCERQLDELQVRDSSCHVAVLKPQTCASGMAGSPCPSTPIIISIVLTPTRLRVFTHAYTHTHSRLQGVTPVHANFYKAAAELHKIEAKFAEFYASALRYLGCIDVADLQEV
jgi:hypothetical protein